MATSINHIANGEQGLSVREKLNKAFDILNKGPLNPFDQSLNQADSPRFSGFKLRPTGTNKDVVTVSTSDHTTFDQTSGNFILNIQSGNLELQSFSGAINIQAEGSGGLKGVIILHAHSGVQALDHQGQPFIATDPKHILTKKYHDDNKNPFNQNLNTSNAPTFDGLTVQGKSNILLNAETNDFMIRGYSIKATDQNDNAFMAIDDSDLITLKYFNANKSVSPSPVSTNPFDQDLNTTNNVSFNSVSIKTQGSNDNDLTTLKTMKDYVASEIAKMNPAPAHTIIPAPSVADGDLYIGFSKNNALVTPNTLSNDQTVNNKINTGGGTFEIQDTDPESAYIYIWVPKSIFADKTRIKIIEGGINQRSAYTVKEITFSSADYWVFISNQKQFRDGTLDSITIE